MVSDDDVGDIKDDDWALLELGGNIIEDGPGVPTDATDVL